MTEDWLSAAIAARKPFAFGELRVSFEDGDAIVEVPGEGTPRELEPDTDGLREWSRVDVHGRYRPLPGAYGLRRAWRTRCAVEQLRDVLGAIYPLAPRHVAAASRGELRVVSAPEALGRQGGRYAPVRDLSPGRLDVARAELCGRCVKTPFWDEGGHELAEGVIPCPEPCSVFIALARELALLGDPPEPQQLDPDVQFAAFEEAGNEIREACIVRLRGEEPPPSP